MNLNITAFGRFGKGGRMVKVYVVDFSSHRSRYKEKEELTEQEQTQPDTSPVGEPKKGERKDEAKPSP